ncbi:tol-pal system protein YbgF [Hyphomicrobium sulfonivorans]|uniref:tol-pal system protein YbgF n=1 Tax=Hyphomicrobium sulfonivorans TaxID=121290 RepID=UPI0015714ACC|nr:tol-pal system protein YbgF [Hyphomicrobium sulfonivorans]MBI1649969.1 tol-pal system protein YbgF [Hyphomicrobium sulfonivorans]NSL72888.1 tol-pal system protein YbgF [Hyphomicrobium sulfonivorans]
MLRHTPFTPIRRRGQSGLLLASALLVAPCLLPANAAQAAAEQPLRIAQAAPAGQGAPKAASTASSANSEAAALRRRVEQLEEQLVDMQVMIGTLESLARGGGGGASGGGGGADGLRLDGLETQMRALSAQVQQLTDQIRAMGGNPRRSDAGDMGGNGGGFATQLMPAAGQPADFGATVPDTARFGSTTVTAGSGNDSIGGLIESDGAAGAMRGAQMPGGNAAAADPAPEMAALPPAFGAATALNAAEQGNAKQLYETAYGYLMQRDYPAAQGAFEDFLGRYPQDSLAGNAQYWLGEAYFVRGEYKAAAAAFLKGYQNYAGNARAADSLLKLAMSLDRLGQKDAACSSFGELSTRFPNAAENVKSRAKEERQRIGCG